MSPETPEFIVPSDQILSILKMEDLPVDTQPVPVTPDLLERRVAIATVYEHDEELRTFGLVHIGRVSLISEGTGIVHLTKRENPGAGNASLVMPETFNSPIALDPTLPNRTTLFPVRALFYVLPQRRAQA